MLKEDFLEDVNVQVMANIYFEGLVQSRTLITNDGKKKTLGVYLPGEYTFDSHEAEKVKITNGEVEVLFPGDEDWRKISIGETYDVPPQCSFQVRCKIVTEYICDYLK